MAINCRLNRVDRSNGDLDIAVQNESQLVEHFDSHRVADRHQERVVFERERNYHVFAGHRLGHEFDDRGRDFPAVEIDEFVSVRVGLSLTDDRTRHVAQSHQRIADADAHVRGHVLGLGELIAADHSLFDEFYEPIDGHGTNLDCADTDCPRGERVNGLRERGRSQRQSGAALGGGQIRLVKLRPEAIRARRVKHVRSDALRRTLWATARNAPNVTRSILMRAI